jgi:hypothetical protein
VDPPFVEDGEKIQASQRSEQLKKAIKDHNKRIDSGFNISLRNKGLD